MALALWVFALLGSACLVSANIFGEFCSDPEALGQRLWRELPGQSSMASEHW